MNLRCARTAAIIFAAIAPVVMARAANPPTILLIVPSGADVARIETARKAAAAHGAVLIVGAAERIPLKGGLELVSDRTFADAPSASIVLVLPGDAPGLVEYLSACRKTARAILFLGESPLERRLRGDGSPGAIVLVGGAEALATLFGGSSIGEPEAPRAAASIPAATATHAATPTPPGGAVRRYFSAPRSTPTPAH